MTFAEFKQQCADGSVTSPRYYRKTPEGLHDVVTCYQEVVDSVTLDEVELLWYLRSSRFKHVRDFRNTARELYEASQHFTALKDVSYHDFCTEAEYFNQSRAIEQRKFLEEEARSEANTKAVQ